MSQGGCESAVIVAATRGNRLLDDRDMESDAKYLYTYMYFGCVFILYVFYFILFAQPLAVHCMLFVVDMMLSHPFNPNRNVDIYLLQRGFNTSICLLAIRQFHAIAVRKGQLLRSSSCRYCPFYYSNLIHTITISTYCPYHL